MTDKTKELLEKYDLEEIVKPIMEHYNDTSIRGGSFVVIDPKGLSFKKTADELISKRGQEFYNNLMVLAKQKKPLYVSALKIVKPTSAYMAETAPNNFEEADLIIHNVPGLYHSPITVPTSILKMAVSPMFINQHPISDEFASHHKTEKGTPAENEYIKGKQPKGTVNNGGNN